MGEDGGGGLVAAGRGTAGSLMGLRWGRMLVSLWSAMVGRGCCRLQVGGEDR